MENTNQNLYINITQSKDFGRYTLMITDIPSHATEDELDYEIKKLSNRPLGELHPWLSRKVGQDTNEGFGYITTSSSDIYNYILSLKVVVKKQKIGFKKPMTVQKMRDYLLDLKARQLHVSGLNKKIGKNELIEYFSQFGEIRTAALAKHFKTERLLGFATVEFKHANSLKQVMQVPKHIICGKSVKCKQKLLKSEIDQIRPYDKSKYGVKGIKDPSRSRTKGSKSKTNKSSNNEDPTKNLNESNTNQQFPDNPQYKKRFTSKPHYVPPPLGDVQRSLDPRVQAFRQQGQARMQKYKVDYRSDLRDIKFNTKPHYDFYFSAPDQQIVNHLSQNHMSGVNAHGATYQSPNGRNVPSGHNRTYSGNNLNPMGNEKSWHKSSGHKMKNRLVNNTGAMGYNGMSQYNHQQRHNNMGVVYNSPVPPGQAESGGMEMMMDMQYMPYWNGQAQPSNSRPKF